MKVYCIETTDGHFSAVSIYADRKSAEDCLKWYEDNGEEGKFFIEDQVLRSHFDPSGLEAGKRLLSHINNLLPDKD